MELRALRKKLRGRKKRNDKDTWRWRLTFVGAKQQHNYFLYYVVDNVMLNVPGIGSIIELGTGHGALSTVLGLWGLKLEIPVLTIDKFRVGQRKLLDKLGVVVKKASIWDKEIMDLIAETIGDKPTFVVCDNGSKAKEFNTWAPKVPTGSILGVHDYGLTEWGYDEIQKVAEEYTEPFMKELWERMFVQFAMFKRK